MDDWLAIWDAADEADRSAALAHVSAKATAACESEVAKGMTGASRVPAPEVIDARRAGNQLIATLGWTHWVYYYAQSGSDWSVQTIGLDEVTVEAGAVVGERQLGTRALHFSEQESDDLDVMQQFRETVGELRDHAAIVEYVSSRLQEECDARGMSVARPVSVELIEKRLDGDRLVSRTCGWYRVYAPASPDQSTRYLAIDEVTVERGTVVDAQTITRLDGRLTGIAATDALAAGLDDEHVRYIAARFRTTRAEALAGWTIQTEERRQRVLTSATERVVASCRARGLTIVEGPHTSVVAATSTGSELVVVTCSHYRSRSATGQDLAGAQLIQTTDYAGLVGHDPAIAREVTTTSDDTARGLAEELAIAYPALWRVRAKLAAESKALQKELARTAVRPPQIVLLAIERAGAQMVVTTSGSFAVWPSDDDRAFVSRAGTQVVAIDRSTIENGVVISEQRLLTKRLDVGTTVDSGHDEAAAAAAVVAEFRRQAT
jgi:hypothetical protein